MDIEEGPIWAVLREKAPDRAPEIKRLAEDAAGKLKLVRDTFPTYTLHDEVHAANVVRLMGDLLGERVADLSGLEAAMLILAAYYHDIGMVYRPEELDRIPDEPEFKSYLRGRPKEFLAVQQHDGRLPLSVVENYCRHRHADRVHDHLARVSDRLMWEVTPIYTALGDVCRSHNLTAADLRADTFEPDFLGECDLRLCALLLRLADILDLDSSRTPRSVYEHLSLAARATARTARSDDEWRKHLCAGGFKFPAERPPNYALLFRAGPEHPAVEHELRAFLDVVDDELRRCRPVLDACAPHWRSLSLPGGVDRRYIIGKHYTYGEFRFELDRTGVLELFMGERLYEDPYVFIRELLQNAIDATRLRTALPDPAEAPEVAVTCWEDGDGFLWVRVDDDGTGMDEHTLREYFLRVGRSYYESAELRADLARSGHGDQDFLAVSRFGIGVLSCFIAGDQVELSTRRILPDGRLAEPLRLSLARDEEFFVLRERPHPPTPMPRRGGSETEYRIRPGTSIAVRIDPTKVDVAADELAKRVDSCVRFPPFRVTYNGRPAGDPPVDDLDRPLLDAPVSVSTRGVPEPHDDKIPYHGTLELGVLPLDLTAASPTTRLRGQFLAVGARVEPGPDGREPADLLAGWPEEQRARLPAESIAALSDAVLSSAVLISREGGKFLVSVTLILRDRRAVSQALSQYQRQPSPLGRLADALADRQHGLLTMRVRVPDGLLPPLASAERLGWRWAHNGIALPDATEAGVGVWEQVGSESVLLGGDLGLADHLRPDVPVSRDAVRGVPFPVHSALRLALGRAARRHYDGPLGWLARLVRFREVLVCPPAGERRLESLLRDPLLSGGAWDQEPIGPYDEASAAAVRARPRPIGGLLEPYRDARWSGSSSVFRAGEHVRTGIMRTALDLAWVPPADPPTRERSFQTGRIKVRSGRRPNLPSGLDRFPPLFFLPYEAPGELLLHQLGPVNQANPVGSWLIEHSETLATTLPVLFAQLRRTLVGGPGEYGPDALNVFLDKVAATRPELRPPARVHTRYGSENYEWWTR